MNVSAALRVFEVKTLAEVAGSTYGDLKGDSAEGEDVMDSTGINVSSNKFSIIV